MFDISFHVVTMECPGCQYPVEVLLKQIMAEETIICLGCRQEVQLRDEANSAKHVQLEIDAAIVQLQRQMKRLGK